MAKLSYIARTIRIAEDEGMRGQEDASTRGRGDEALDMPASE
jgi:hypothetical protein